MAAVRSSEHAHKEMLRELGSSRPERRFNFRWTSGCSALMRLGRSRVRLPLDATSLTFDKGNSPIKNRYKGKNNFSEYNTALDQGSRKAVQPPSLEILQTRQDKTLSNFEVGQVLSKGLKLRYSSSFIPRAYDSVENGAPLRKASSSPL